MEYDAVTNRYYPSHHLKKLLKERQSRKDPVSVNEGNRSFGAVRIILSPFDRLLLGDSLSFGVSGIKIFQVVLSKSKESVCGLPTFTVKADPTTCIHNLQHKPAIRDCTVSHNNELWFGGDGGLWSPSAMVPVGEQDAVHQVTSVGENVLFCSSDTVGLFDPTSIVDSKNPKTVSGHGFKSVVSLGDALLVSATNGRLLHLNMDTFEQQKTSTPDKLVFQKMVAMADCRTILALTFSGHLYILDQHLKEVSVIGLLHEQVSMFCTDGEQLVLCKSEQGEFTLFNLMDPTERLCHFTTASSCTDLLYSHGLFSVMLNTI